MKLLLIVLALLGSALENGTKVANASTYDDPGPSTTAPLSPPATILELPAQEDELLLSQESMSDPEPTVADQPVSAAVPTTGQRIVGGSPTTVEQYPYMANMQYAYLGSWWFHACGGSILTNNAILSAAHCYFGDAAQSWNVRLGTSFANMGSGSRHFVSQIILHPEYNSPSRLNNDVAIIKLQTPVAFESWIQPARIAGVNYNLADGTTVTAIGWGALTAEGTYPEQLQHVDVDTINQEVCAERYAYLKTQQENTPDVTEGMMCAGILDVGGKDACDGDSGGPLLHAGDVVVGVTSWGAGCAHAYYPGVYARVSRYVDWIVNNA